MMIMTMIMMMMMMMMMTMMMVKGLTPYDPAHNSTYLLIGQYQL